MSPLARNIILILFVAGVIFALVTLFNRDNGDQMVQKVTNDPKAMEEMCKNDLKEQEDYLNKETLSSLYTFDKYTVISTDDKFAPHALDANSSKYAREFKTKLREQLLTAEVNFARNYAIVAVGMTGWGNNYWIVNRRNGQAFEFPYHAYSLEFDVNSNLIIMNSKESIIKLLAENPEGGCYFLNQEKVSELRPFYFKWENEQLVLLAPIDNKITPSVNQFWIDYLSDIPDGTPDPIVRFIREVKREVIADISRVPREGYSGFAIIKALPGILPEDFIGITTDYGDFRVNNGELEFMGNAPSNAASLTLPGFTKLLENISKRLHKPISTTDEVDEILNIIR